MLMIFLRGSVCGVGIRARKEKELYLRLDYEWFNYFSFSFPVFSKLSLMNMYSWCNRENHFVVEKDYCLVSVLLPKGGKFLCSGPVGMT